MNYQTVPLPDGKELAGLFPTIDWFKEIAKHIDFSNKSILDIGCCQFSYGISALNSGASYAIGIDCDQQRLEESKHYIDLWGYNEKTKLINSKAEELSVPHTDIILFSNVIHWMDNAEYHIARIVKNTKIVVFIYRVRGYEHDTGYLPTLDELNNVIGSKANVHEVISDTLEQNIRLSIYIQ